MTWANQPGGTIIQLFNNEPCGEGPTTVAASVTATDDGPLDKLVVTLTFSGFADGSRRMQRNGSTWSAEIGPFTATGEGNAGGTLNVSVTVSDGAKSASVGGATVAVQRCFVPQ